MKNTRVKTMAVGDNVVTRFYERMKETQPKMNSQRLIEKHFDAIQEMLASGSNILFIWEFLHEEGMFPNGYSAFRKALKTVLEKKQQEQLRSTISKTTESESTLKDW